MRQVEVSRTLVFDDPRRARAFFEPPSPTTSALGWPDQVSTVFARRVRKDTPGIFRICPSTPGTDVSNGILRYKDTAARSRMKRETAPFRSKPSTTRPPVRSGASAA